VLRRTHCRNWPWLCCLLIFLSGSLYAFDTGHESLFDTEQINIRYNLTGALAVEAQAVQFSEGFASDEPPAFGDRHKGYKSPAKAFLLSLAVPGLGQFYYGSKIKPVLFLGAEVTAWVLYFKWHNEGDDITAEYEAFNRDHWLRDRYEQEYLSYVYGVTDDEDVPASFTEVTHNLPDTRTQQYYEMTGKYDQFAWGWDDAVLDGEVLGPNVQAITGPEITPYSANRLFYETRRNDANNSYDKATRMVIVSFANRLFSAFEAFFATKSINAEARRQAQEFGRIKLDAKLKSFYSWRDTPCVTVTYKF